VNKIGYIAVFVSDMNRAVDFYEKKLGMSVKARSEEFPVWVEMATEGATFALNSATPELVGRPTGITFMVGDLQGLYDRMQAGGVRFSAPPERPPWGGLTATVLDPDGNEIGLLEEMA
jgi:predicted enzyme related to lactoylglutathione lyase